MPLQVCNEVARFRGLLPQWLRQSHVGKALVLAEPTNGAFVQRVLTQGYAPDLRDVQLEKVAQDPFLTAAALNGPDRIVVTRENSKPSMQRANRKIPDVCAISASSQSRTMSCGGG